MGKSTVDILNYALRGAVVATDLVAIEDLLMRGADPNATDVNGVPLLFLAAEEGNPEVLRAILSAGANPNVTLKGLSVLHYLASHSRSTYDETAIRTLIEAGTDLNHKANVATNLRGLTPIKFAQYHGLYRLADWIDNIQAERNTTQKREL